MDEEEAERLALLDEIGELIEEIEEIERATGRPLMTSVDIDAPN